MSYQQTELDPLPVPQAKDAPESVQPKVQEAPQVPAGAGFASKGAVGAQYANAILSGMMAGKHIREERKLKAAQMEVGNAHDQYQGYAEQYKRAIDNGMDQNSEEFKQLKNRVQTTWNDYVNAASKYVSEDGEGGGKKKGGKKGEETGFHKVLQHMFGVSDPKLFSDALVRQMRASGPQVFGYTQDEKRKLEIENEKKQGKVFDKQLERETKAGEHEAHVADLRTQLEQAQKSGDVKKQQELRGQLAAQGVSIEDVKTPEQVEADRKVQEARTSAIGKFGQGYNAAQLTPLEQIAVGYHPTGDGFDYYLKEVKGPGNPQGKYPNEMAAWKSYEEHQRAMQLIGRSPSQAVLSDKDVSTYLQGALQSEVGVAKMKREFPELAGKLHVLKQGEKPDPSIVAAVKQSKVMSWNAKQDFDAAKDTAFNKAWTMVAKNMPAKEQQMAKDLFVFTDENGKVHLNPPEMWPTENSHWFKGNTIKGPSGESYNSDEARQAYTKFVGRMRQGIKSMYPGADESVIDEVVGGVGGPSNPPEDDLKMPKFAGTKKFTVTYPDTKESVDYGALTYDQVTQLQGLGAKVTEKR